MRPSTLTSSAQCAARALRSQTARSAYGRRALSTTTARRSGGQQGSQSSSQGSAQQRGWDTKAVLAIAAVAGSVGWAFANANREKPLGSGFLPQSTGIALLAGGKSSQPEYGSVAEMEAALKEIRGAIDLDDIISTDAEDLHNHGYSEWSSTNPDTLPVAVAYPRSTEQVSIIAKICHKYRVPIIPYSGGTSLEGNFSAPFGGISVDFAFMDQILQFNKEDMDIVVQPSIGWQDLNAQLAKLEAGLFFPIDPGTTSSRVLWSSCR